MWEIDAFGATLLDVTIGDMLDAQATRFAEREAIVFPELGLRWTYAELRIRVDRLALGLIGLGVQPGERVAVLAPNMPEWLLLDYALAKVGVVLVTVNTGYRQHELEYVLRQGRVAALFTASGYRGTDYLALVRAARETGLPALRRVIESGGAAFEALRPGGGAPASLAARQAAVRPGDIAQIQYTSGTTIPPTMLAALREAFGTEPMVIMGMTEASPLITQTRPEDGFERNREDFRRPAAAPCAPTAAWSARSRCCRSSSPATARSRGTSPASSPPSPATKPFAPLGQSDCPLVKQ